MVNRETLTRLLVLEQQRQDSGTLPDKITLVTVERNPSTGNLVEVGEPIVLWRDQSVEDMTDDQLAAAIGAVGPLDCGKTRMYTTETIDTLTDTRLQEMRVNFRD